MFSDLKTALLAPLALTAAVTGALAGEPMDGAAFDDYTRGKTLFYAQNGEAYGAEIYLDNRRVKWSFLDGNCKEGSWYEQDEQICFVYEDNPEPQCWAFHSENGRLIARFENLPGATQLYEATDVNAEMICLGPDVGV
jgi:hypothetical protein